MILYALDTRWNFGEIKEWLVEKETEKTYIIRRPNDRPFSNGKYHTNTIRKANMRIYDLIFFHSHEAALTKYKQMLADRIATCKNNIKGLEARIVEYEERLKSLEAET